MSKCCRDGFCFTGYARRGGAWGRGQGTEYVLTLYFHLRKIGRVSVKIHLYPYATPDYFCDLNSVKFVQYKDYNSLLILEEERCIRLAKSEMYQRCIRLAKMYQAGKSGWRSEYQSSPPPLLEILYVDWVSVDFNPTSRVFSGHSGFLPPQNRLPV